MNLDKKDLRITRLRNGGGNGGQNKNKVETAVRIEHIPTGVVVTANNERTQNANMQAALQRLAGRLQARELEAKAEKQRREWEGKPSGGFGDRKIRTYYFHRERVARDHRTGVEVEIDRVMNGEIDDFLNAALANSVRS